jgi:hypothetical protein
MTNVTSIRRAVRPALILALGLAMTSGAAAREADGGAGPVKVTLKYTGQGTVDKEHQLWVWLFDTPEIGPGTMPIAELSLDSNGGTATFVNIGTDKVWVAVAYDINGAMTGNAPPASGSPVAIYVEGEMPAPIVPGDKAVVMMTFDDSRRMP